jgi:hypothetical protein
MASSELKAANHELNIENASSTNLAELAQRQRISSLERLVMQHATDAVKGFFKSIRYASWNEVKARSPCGLSSLHSSPAQSLQDALRILGIWFQHGDRNDVRSMLLTYFRTYMICLYRYIEL